MKGAFLPHTHAHGRFQGVLRSDAPGLYASLRRVHGDHLDLFEEAYRLSGEAGGLEEAPVERKAGASYNPRPARVCSILLREYPDAGAELLTSALLCPADMSRILKALSSAQNQLLKNALQAAGVAGHAVQTRNHSTLPAGSQAEALTLASLLDLLRHLHMSTMPDAKQREYCHFASRLISASISRLETMRLRVLLETATLRIEQRLV